MNLSSIPSFSRVGLSHSDSDPCHKFGIKHAALMPRPQLDLKWPGKLRVKANREGSGDGIERELHTWMECRRGVKHHSHSE